MTINTLKLSAGLNRKNGQMPVASVKNRVIESKKYKKRHMDAWKKEIKAYV